MARFWPAIPDLVHQFPSLNERVGAELAADPDADVDGSLAVPCCIPPSNQFQRAHHARRTFELLAGKQSQRVTHEGASPSSRRGMPQAAPYDEKRDEAKVGFGLAATSGKPDEVQHLAKRVLFPDHGLHGRQQECQLKRTPVVGAGVPAGHPVCLAHLIQHGAVRQPKRLLGERVRAQHLDARAHPFEGNAHPPADTVRGSPFPPVRERRRDANLLGNPVGVSVDKALELIRYRRRGEPGEGEDTLFSERLDGDQRHFSLGHEVGPDPRWLATFELPVYRSAVTDGVDSLLPVLKLKLLLLLGEQTRIDSWVVDKLAAVDHTFQASLEQCLLHPVACSVSTRSIRVEFPPVRQGDRQDEATSMWPGASVYAGAPVPDSIAGLVACSSGRRPGHGALRKLGPLVQRAKESAPLVTLVVAIMVDGGGWHDGETNIAPNEEREACRGRRDVAAPAGRLRNRLIVRRAVRGRRVILVVEEGFFGFVGPRQSRVYAGTAMFDGMQHSRRISIPRGH